MAKVITVTVPSNPVDVIVVKAEPNTPKLIEYMVPGLQGPTGLKGDKGDTGPADLISIGTIATSLPGSAAVATITGASPNRKLNLTIPQGPKGDTGPANVLTIGTVSNSPAGGSGSATITGTAPNQVLNLVLPRGASPNVAIGAVTTGAEGTAADAAIVGTSPNYTLNLTIPRGNTGAKGDQGIQGIQGDKGDQGIQGIQGIQGLKGDTGLTGDTGATGPGVPTGGVAGAILQKASATNYDTSWLAATSSATPSTVAVRDSAGRIAVVTDVSSSASVATNKGYVDAIGTRVTNLEAGPAIRVRRMAAQSVVSGWNTILWDTLDNDAAGTANFVNGNAYVTVSKTGYYWMSYGANLSGNVSGRRALRCWTNRNGADLDLYIGNLVIGSGIDMGVQASGLAYLIAGDKIRCDIFQDSGATQSINTQDYSPTMLNLIWIRGA